MLSKTTSKRLGASLALLALLWIWCPSALAANCSTSISGPCNINSSNAYSFTGNVVQTGSTDAITFTSTVNNVSIDMGGWKLTGGSSGQGIDACSTSCTPEDITVTNGHAYNSGSHGIDTGNDVSDIEDVQAISNGGNGLFPSAQGIVYHIVATGNTTTGINTSSYNVVERVVAASNSSDGIDTSTGGVVSESVAASNTTDGLNLGSGTGYARNVTGANTTGCAGSGTSMGENLCN
jgi:hypothetical protein